MSSILDKQWYVVCEEERGIPRACTAWLSTEEQACSVVSQTPFLVQVYKLKIAESRNINDRFIIVRSDEYVVSDENGAILSGILRAVKTAEKLRGDNPEYRYTVFKLVRNAD